MIKQSSTLATTYKNVVGEVEIRYSVRQEGGAPIESVNANIQKGDQYMGTANIDANGSTGVSLVKGLSAEERTAILTAIVNDTNEIFTGE